MRLRHLEAEEHHRNGMFLELFFVFLFAPPSPLSLFLYLLMPEPISTRLCLRGGRQPEWEDVRLEISLQGIKRRRCCSDYSALLPVPAHEIMSARQSAVLDPPQRNEINHVRPLEIGTNVLTFSCFFCLFVFGGGLVLSFEVCVCCAGQGCELKRTTSHGYPHVHIQVSSSRVLLRGQCEGRKYRNEWSVVQMQT